MSLSKEKEKLLGRLRHPRLRGREGLFLVEGVRGSREFLNATLPTKPRFALTSPRLAEVQGGLQLKETLAAKGVDTTDLSDRDIQAWSDTDRSQGILLVMEEPESDWPPSSAASTGRFLLLDGIQDPGNVGTLIRAALAFGGDGVVVLDGTVDPWNPKAVRASAGAAAHLPLARARWSQVREWITHQDIPLLVAESQGKDVREMTPPLSWALVLGNEGAGVRPEIRERADASLAVSISSKVESLNVATAGAILLFALTPSPEPPGTS
jgi:TrmH family RNA methyltransferase